MTKTKTPKHKAKAKKGKAKTYTSQEDEPATTASSPEAGQMMGPAPPVWEDQHPALETLEEDDWTPV